MRLDDIGELNNWIVYTLRNVILCGVLPVSLS